MYLKFSKTFS